MNVLIVQTALANLIHMTHSHLAPVPLLTTPSLITAVEVSPEGDPSLSTEGSSPTVKDEQSACGVSVVATAFSQSQTVHSVGKSLHPQHRSLRTSLFHFTVY